MGWLSRCCVVLSDGLTVTSVLPHTQSLIPLGGPLAEIQLPLLTEQLPYLAVCNAHFSRIFEGKRDVHYTQV